MLAVAQIEQAPSHSYSSLILGTKPVIQDTLDSAYAAFHYYLFTAVYVEQLTRGNYSAPSAEPTNLQFQLQPIFVRTETAFNRLVERWKRETGDYSVIARRYQHRSYQSILDMKQDAIPLILNELRREPDRWFDALQRLTGENPAKDADNFYEAVDLWVAWGVSENYIS